MANNDKNCKNYQLNLLSLTMKFVETNKEIIENKDKIIEKAKQENYMPISLVEELLLKNSQLTK